MEVLQDTTGDRKRAVSDVQSDAVGGTGGLDGPLAARVGRDVHDERTAVADGEHRTVGRGGGHGHHGSHHDEGTAVDVKVSGQRHWEAVEEVDTGAGLCALEGLVVRHPGAVHVGLVKVDRSGLQEQLNLVAEAKATGGVPRRGHFGLVLAGSTPSEDVVIAVGVAVGVTGDDPRFSHARGVGLGNTNLEERGGWAGRGVHHGGANAVARLVHLGDDAVDQGLTVQGHLREPTVPDGRGGRNVHRTAGGVTAGVSTVSKARAVVVADVDEHDVAVRRGLGKVVAAAVNVAGGHFDRSQGDLGVAAVDGIHGGVVVVDGRALLHHDRVGGRGREAVQTADVCVLEDEAPGTAVDGQVTDVQVLPGLGFRVRRGAGNRHVARTDVLKDAEVDALHRDVAGLDVHHDRVIAHGAHGGGTPAVGGDPQVSAAEVDVVHVHAGHGVEAAVGVIRHADVVEVNVGVAAVHGVDGHTGLAGRVGDAHVGNGHVLQINIDEVHVGVRDGDVLDEEAASGGSWVVDDRATPRLSVCVAVLQGTFRQDGDGVLSEVETRIVRAVHGEVRHLDDRPLTRAVLEGRSDVREGHVVHGEVAHVGVGAGGAAVAAARGNRGVAGVAEVDVRELVSVVGAGRTRAGERHALPIGASLALDGDRVGRVAVDLHLVAGAVKGNSLAVGHLNHDAGLNGEVSGDGQVVVARVDADWAVVDVPRGVRGDVGVNVRTLAVVWHGAVADAAVNRRVVVAVVGGVVAPPWRNRAGARRRVARVGHGWEVAAPRGDTALEARGSVVDEVHVALTAQADAVVRVGALVEGAEVLEVEVIGHVDVRVAAGLVGVPVPAVGAVVAVRGTAAAAADRRVVVLDLGQAWREALVAVARRGGVHAVVGGERVGSVEPSVALLQGLTLRTGLVLVPRHGVIDVDLTAGVVLELELVGHVVEDNLVGAEVRVGVPHVVPFDDEHLVRVTDFERGSRGLNGVRRGHVGGDVLSRDVVLDVVRGVQVGDVSRPVAGRQDTLRGGLADGGHDLGHRGTVVHAVVEGRTRTGRCADVQASGRGTAVGDGRGHRARAGVGVRERGVGDRRRVGVGLGSDLHHVVGDGGAGTGAGVVARAERESVPLVVRVVGVVVSRGTAWAAGGGAQEVRPAVGARAHDVLAGAGVGRVPGVAREVTGDVTGNHVAVCRAVPVGRNLGSGAAAGQRLFDAGLVTDTNHRELVAVPEEDEVHAGAVVGGDAEVATVVVVEVDLTGA